MSALLNKFRSGNSTNKVNFDRIKEDSENFYLKNKHPYSNLIFEHNMAMYNFINNTVFSNEVKQGKFDINKLFLLALYHENHKDHDIPREVKKELGTLYDSFLEIKKNDLDSKVSGEYYSNLFESNLPLLIFRTIDVSKIPLNGDKDLLVNWFGFNPKKLEEEKSNLAKVMFNVYYPISDILGLNSVLNDIKNISVKTLYPSNYNKIESNLRLNYDYLQEIKNSFEFELNTLMEINKSDVNFCKFEDNSLIKGRVKSAGSIVLKMIEKDLPITKMLELHDLVAYTVLVENEDQARYFWNFIKEKYNHGDVFSEDFITNPRGKTGYQALHVDIYHRGVRVEVQIKTPEMYVRSERGDWSHAIYKNDEMKPGLLKLSEFVSILKSSSSFQSNAPYMNLRGSRLIAYYSLNGLKKEMYLDKYSTIFDMIMQSKITRDPFKVKVFSENTGSELYYSQLVNEGSSYIFKIQDKSDNIPKKILYDIRACSVSGESNFYLSNLIKKIKR